MIDIGILPGGTSSEAIAINSRGQVVGWSHSSSGSSLFLWENGTMLDLGIGGNPLPKSALYTEHARRRRRIGCHWRRCLD